MLELINFYLPIAYVVTFVSFAVVIGLLYLVYRKFEVLELTEEIVARGSWVLNGALLLLVGLVIYQVGTSYLINLFLLPNSIPVPDWIVSSNGVLLYSRGFLVSLTAIILLLSSGFDVWVQKRGKKSDAISINKFFLWLNVPDSLTKLTTSPRWLASAAAVVLFVYSAILRFTNLGKPVFHHDEFWYASSSLSMINEGVSRLWNPVTFSATERTYPELFTRLFAYFGDLLGYSEFSLRFPVAIFGVLAVILTWYVAKKITKSNFIAILAAAIVTTGDIATYMSRFLRHYSAFAVASLALFLLFIWLINRLEKSRKVSLWELVLPLAIVFAMHQLITPFAISYYVIFVGYYIYAFYVAKEQRRIMLALVLTGLLVLVLDVQGIFKIIDVKHILTNSFELGFQEARFNDYIEWSFGESRLPSVIALAMSLPLSFYAVIRRNSRLILMSSFVWVPFILLNINIERSYDFRYTMNVLPFVAISVAWGIYALIRKIKINVVRDAVAVLAILILPAFTFPGIEVYPFIDKAQADWQGADPLRLDRRAILPAYSEAFDEVAKLTNPGDAVIIGDGELYLEAETDTDYFELSNWVSTYKVRNYETRLDADFFELVRDREQVIVVTSNLHGLHPSLAFYLINSCVNQGARAGGPQNFYHEFYANEPTSYYYPNLFVCQGQD